MSDAPLRDCPACGAPALVKQVTAAGFQLKGSGWYVTDFRGGGNGNTGAPAPSGQSAEAAAAPASAPAAPATPAASS